ncbi:transcription termination factor MTERF2, chloroplastic [Amborella trichopoda]|uniref:Uncharacterized protein n=1 Tax=Amborella trichopoda TaxID=13333 RepID=W1PWJ1_AMBTC|nr:transcription termination factor MTERF2, chloroplastic [Amborella trichopoda]ERN12533.1 hypothetical protein AMTR_s00025p00195930 [Amborella trichopoda]|eukprot:XP_006850952.1 transcription termination factor MTERF2, chloroplastic [Amborella trichopoda]
MASTSFSLSPIPHTHHPKRHFSIKTPPLSVKTPFLPYFDGTFKWVSPLRPRTPILCDNTTSESSNGEEFDESVLAKEAIAEMLLQLEVSEEEVQSIANNCPKYIGMVIDGVHELDELSLWDSWQIDKEIIGHLSFKRKFVYMVKEKGDNGILPFLESIGLNPSSSTHIARYLSSEKLIDLIAKVKCLKEILFSDGDEISITGKNTRRMMMHLSISTDDDIQRTLSFFEKMEARRGGLNMLDFEDASFPYLIESFPRLLLCSVESHLKPLIEFLKLIGVSEGSIRSVFLSFPPIILYDIEREMKPRMRNLEKLGFDNKDIGKMIRKYPWILSSSIQANYSKILAFFSTEKVPKLYVDGAIKSWPHILGCSINRMKLLVEQFGEMGVTNDNLGRVIASCPQLLLQKPQNFVMVVSFLEELGFNCESVGKILSRCPEIFAASIEGTLKKKIDFLIALGISHDHLPRIIRKYPELLVCDIHKALQPRMKYLMKVGLTKREVASMIHRFSPLLGYSIEKVLRPKLEFLVYTMHKPVRDVVDYPRYFSYSLEKKIKPRFWVLKGRNVQCSLKEMLGKNDEDFASDFMGIGRMLVPPV